MNFDALIFMLGVIFPKGEFWINFSRHEDAGQHAETGVLMIETGLRHFWPASLANRIRPHLPEHSVSLDPRGMIRLNTGMVLNLTSLSG